MWVMPPPSNYWGGLLGGLDKIGDFIGNIFCDCRHKVACRLDGGIGGFADLFDDTAALLQDESTGGVVPPP